MSEKIFVKMCIKFQSFNLFTAMPYKIFDLFESYYVTVSLKTGV